MLYFISFLLLVGFFVLNMFVGVVVENFHRCRAELEKEERAARAVKRARKIEERKKRKEHSVTTRRFIKAKKKSPEMCFFLFQKVYIDMTKKR